ncbi:MAG TPA: hypothetical protein VIU29_09885, partial [Candidatus Deferrimicrobiaceae bacterium]
MSSPQLGGTRKTILFRLFAAFAILLVATTIAGIVVLRYIVKRDLEGTTRRELVSSMSNLDTDLAQARQDVALYAQLMAGSSSDDLTASPGTSPVAIVLLEKARSRNIEIDEVRESAVPKAYGDLLRRAFAGMPTVDYFLSPGLSTRLSIVAAVPVGGPSNRRVITASMPIGSQFLFQEKRALSGDVSMFTREELLSTSSVCSSCIACIKDVLFDGANWHLIEGGKPLYFHFDCKPEPQ